ncbi:PAS-domain containing protein [Thalassomonas sp. RHCl1]|uniref:hybrid sensor histidine kinase/response regulator n=1 Tax=Thalassomonas sp. RHCl1 TaxID=2995320 RepID=UPI00248B9036|nr:PAS-domain containing protein [Thalassomonas sp. RHCl1]
MFENWQLVLLSLSYTGLLFYIASVGNRHRHKKIPGGHALIYALTLGVYCTSWSFLGTSGQAASSMLSYLPIYLGPILLFTFAWSFIQRLIRVSLKLNLTSIADLLAARFGKSHKLAVLVTIVALIGTLPYLALQLKAIVYSLQSLSHNADMPDWQIGLVLSLLLTGFTIIFGVRTIDVTERHPGVMLAIAFESLVKLLAFFAVGIFAVFFIYDSPTQLWQLSQANMKLEQQLQAPNLISMFGLLIIVMSAFLCLPRQFQVMAVELKSDKHTGLSRTLFPLYLLVFAVFAIPLGLAGELVLGDKVSPDAYVLLLPAVKEQTWLTLLVFIGAVSAASSMVIISSIALSTMLSNEIVFPKLFRRAPEEHKNFHDFRVKLLTVRKLLVGLVIGLSYGVFLIAPPDTLSSLGQIAFGAVAQLAPALVVAFYWRKASLVGVYSGISIGFILWLTLNLLPEFGLYPQPVTTSYLPANTAATLISLGANILAILWFSQLSRQSVQERMQARHFLPHQVPGEIKHQHTRVIDTTELQALTAHFVGKDKAQTSFNHFLSRHDRKQMSTAAFNDALIHQTENMLAGVMGSSSARLVISSALEGRDIALDDIAFLMEQASSERKAFSHNLLQSAIENASEGISIIDNELNLVAWNKRYLDLFNYPEDLTYIGAPVEKLIRYNVDRGLCGPGDREQLVSRRIQFLKAGSPHSSERETANGKVIRIQGNPLPGGGFVMIFSDITPYRQAEKILTEKNLDLESLVSERTKNLAEANSALEQAHRIAESANQKKSLYLKACSHDLMQPLEAARLFTSALAHDDKLDNSQQRQVKNIDHALKVANDLLSDLTEIARIEGGNIRPDIEHFPLKALMQNLFAEFTLLSKDYQIDFHGIDSRYWVKSDAKLLRRILQNFLGNAFRYAGPGKVLIGCRRRGDQVEIQVLDNGPGIAKDKHQEIFEQFTQLEQSSAAGAKGLGLGLNIARSLSQLLGHELGLESTPGKGCKFFIRVPLVQSQQAVVTPKPAPAIGLTGVNVLCVDNDPDVLNGMMALLKAWQCNIYSASSYHQAQQVFKQHECDIDIMLVDYQLGNGENGIELMTELTNRVNYPLPGILITATTDETVATQAREAGFGYMRKLVKPAALRAMISAMLTRSLQGNYSQK